MLCIIRQISINVVFSFWFVILTISLFEMSKVESSDSHGVVERQSLDSSLLAVTGQSPGNHLAVAM